MAQAKGAGMEPHVLNGAWLVGVIGLKNKVKDGDIVILKKGKYMECKFVKFLPNNERFYQNANGKVFDDNKFKYWGYVTGVFNIRRI